MKKTIKWIGIVFAVIIFLLTFFSKTLLNYTLPCVTVQSVSSGKVISKVRGNGIIESNDICNVTYGYNREVLDVKVRAGEHVEKGDVICTLKDYDREIINEKEKDLLLAKSNYEKLTDELFIKTISGDFYENIDEQEDIYIKVKEIKKTIALMENQITEYQDVVKQFEEYKETVKRQIEFKPEENDYIWNEYQEYKRIKQEFNQKCLDYLEAQNTYNSAEYNLKYKANDENLIKSRDIALKEKENTLIEKDNLEYILLQEEKKLNDIKDTLGTLLQSIEKAIDENERLIEEKTEDKAKLLEELNSIISKVTVTAEINRYENDIELAKIEVNKKQKELDTLISDLDCDTIVAPVSGVVTNVMVQNSHSIPMDSVVASIHPDDGDYCCYITVNKAQSRLVTLGEEAKVLYGMNGQDTRAVVEKLIPNDKDKINKVDIIFNVSGSDITLGQSISLVVGAQGENYDFVVPNSAIREDNTGKFVYILDIDNTPLGLKYYARRVDVNILCLGEGQSAVMGQLEENEYVITSFDKYIADDDQVRIMQ